MAKTESFGPGRKPIGSGPGSHAGISLPSTASIIPWDLNYPGLFGFGLEKVGESCRLLALRKNQVHYVCCGVEYPERPNVVECVSTERPYACTLELADHAFRPFNLPMSMKSVGWLIRRLKVHP